jgi:hypothetical protein
LHHTEVAAKPRLKKPTAELTVPSRVVTDYTRTQDHLLGLILKQPKLRASLDSLGDEMFIGENAKALFAFLREHPDFNGDTTTAAKLQPLGDYVKILLLQYEELYDTVEPTELQYEVSRLQVKLIEQYVKMQKQRLATQFASASEAETKELLEKAKQLDDLLKTHKGGA